MGTTLENGVYLPSEGERNCYAGLKTNWEILDQKVADVTALQQAVAGALHRQIVTQLPTEDIDPNTIYMILSGTSATENVYNEFMYVNNAWELIGTSATDLTNYYTKAEVDGKLLLKASASDLTSHTGDTTIHVTTTDKNRWNNNTYVFRYSSTALTASSTNSNTLLDNTDNLKVGDKVIDSSGVLFSITAIDTANSTFTIGTALIDLAQDSDVVHKSGDETIAGSKTFNDLQIIGYGTRYKGARDAYILPEFSAGYSGLAITTLGYAQTLKIGNFVLDANNKPTLDTSKAYIQIATGENNNVNACALEPRNSTFSSLGMSSNRWSKIYGTEYYYGSNNVEFSTKFVTTDANQTITGNKTFSSINGVEPSSLSLPGYKSSRIDISSYITNLTGGGNNYTVPANGYIFVRTSDGTYLKLVEYPSGACSSVCSQTADDIGTFLPVIAGRTCIIVIKCSSIDRAYFIPCQGNV